MKAWESALVWVVATAAATENDTCVARCPVGQEPDSSYDCGMYIIICTNFSVSLGANEASYLLFYTIDREILTRKSIRLLNFHFVLFLLLRQTRSIVLLVDVQC